MSENNSCKKFLLSKISNVIFLILFPFFCGTFIMVPRVEIILFGIFFILNVILFGFCKIFKKAKGVIIFLRCVITVLFIIILSVPFLLMKFDKTKEMYSLRRFLYNYGVYGGYFDKLIPEKLPENCDDYMFIAQCSFIAQDYHPSSYLVFHTDAETLEEYEKYYSNLEKIELQPIEIEEYIANDGQILKLPNAFPGHVFSRLEQEHISNFENAKIYKIPDYYNKGCIIDYESSLIVIWT